VTSEGGKRIEQSTTLHALIRTILSPYEGQTDIERAGSRSLEICGLRAALVTTFALLLHEFATNAAKYGALSTSAGHIEIACSEPDGQFVVTCE
jgi:two-component sensor histidine kinase